MVLKLNIENLLAALLEGKGRLVLVTNSNDEKPILKKKL